MISHRGLLSYWDASTQNVLPRIQGVREAVKGFVWRLDFRE